MQIVGDCQRDDVRFQLFRYMFRLISFEAPCVLTFYLLIFFLPGLQANASMCDLSRHNISEPSLPGNFASEFMLYFAKGAFSGRVLIGMAK